MVKAVELQLRFLGLWLSVGLGGSQNKLLLRADHGLLRDFAGLISAMANPERGYRV